MRKLAAVASVGILLSVTACGGGGGNDTSLTAANAQAVTVGPGPDSNINLLFTTVTICAPGSSTNCQSIDHVLVIPDRPACGSSLPCYRHRFRCNRRRPPSATQSSTAASSRTAIPGGR